MEKVTEITTMHQFLVWAGWGLVVVLAGIVAYFIIKNNDRIETAVISLQQLVQLHDKEIAQNNTDIKTMKEDINKLEGAVFKVRYR